MKVMEASSGEEFDIAADQLQELIQMSGAMPLSLSVNTKEELAFALIKFVVIERKRQVFQRFLSGLETCGLLEEVRRYPTICRGMFVHSPQPLDARSVDDIFEVQWSTPGSNRQRSEMRTQTHFRNWLQDSEDSDVLIKLLIFVTGLDTVPPLGFQPRPSLTFSHPDDFVSGDPRFGFPIANTCAMRLSLPITEEYETFSTAMSNSVEIVTTFTNQ